MPRVKPHVDALQSPVHGGVSSCSALPKQDVIDFSTSCNPFGPPPQARKAAHRADLAAYPDPDSSRLALAFASRLGIHADNLIIGSGSTELIRLAAAAYLGNGDKAVVPSPTYGEYELACRIAGCDIASFVLREEALFKLDADELCNFAEPHKPAAMFLCNPNNPTGQYIPFDAVSMIVRRFPDALVVLDEAYVAFTDNAWDSLKLLPSPNLLIIRSMTKDLSLAGLRLGYGIAAPAIIAALKKVRPPWNVNSAAQAAGLAALDCDDYLAVCRRRIDAGKRYLAQQLEKMGYEIIPSHTNFFIFRVGDAASFKRRLLDRGFLVRDCTSFGLPQFVRIAPRRLADCRRLIACIREVGPA